MPTLAELGEFEVIRRLAAVRGAPDASIVVDSGDDAAVVRPEPGGLVVLTTDGFVEGRSWRPGWIDPEALGARLAVANLSDLAAMGARPRWALLAAAVRADADVDALVGLQRGLARTLAADGARLVGGNVVAVEHEEAFHLTLVGHVHEGAVWRRAGARAGDLIAVTGHPGRAGAGVRLAARLGDGARDPRFGPLLDAWRSPRSRVALAGALGPLRAVRAAIDLSDGVPGDLAHLCEASGVGAVLDEAAFPDDAALLEAAEALGLPLDALRFGPSDDYELLLAIDPASRAACEAAAAQAAVAFAVIGRCAGDAAARTIVDRAGRERPIPGAGYEHFTRG
jgi:thiamine-monophosphate kinase